MSAMVGGYTRQAEIGCATRSSPSHLWLSVSWRHFGCELFPRSIPWADRGKKASCLLYRLGSRSMMFSPRLPERSARPWRRRPLPAGGGAGTSTWQAGKRWKVTTFTGEGPRPPWCYRWCEREDAGEGHRGCAGGREGPEEASRPRGADGRDRQGGGRTSTWRRQEIKRESFHLDAGQGPRPSR